MRWLLVFLAACTSTATTEVMGPYDGPVQRFAIDRIVLPGTRAAADAYADDLNGDGRVDDQLGYTLATLSQYDDLSAHGGDMIAAGAIASSIEMQVSGGKAGVTYFGADGAAAVVAGGVLVGGAFRSNRTRSSVEPGMAVVHLPVFADADPVVVELDAMELELEPDGSGGYDGTVHGEVSEESLWPAVYAGLSEMIANDPDAHYPLASVVDPERSGTFTLESLKANSLFESLLAPDIGTSLSVGFGIHLVPCEEGTCEEGPPKDLCEDRVRDGDETGVDCGGSCGACAVAQPSCSDGVRDGLETDVDCGWECGACGAGKACAEDADCASGMKCSVGIEYAPGMCISR